MITTPFRPHSCLAVMTAIALVQAGCGAHHHEAPTPPVPDTEPASQPDVKFVTLTSPVSDEIFQRTTANTGNVLLKGHLDAPPGTLVNLEVTLVATPFHPPAATMPKVRVDTPDRPTPGNQELLEVPLNLDADGNFAVPVSLRAGGWNSLAVSAQSTTEEFHPAWVHRVGVGEIFVVGGQSNSTNYGEVKTKATTGYVTVFDGKSWTPAADPLPGVDGKGGSPWCIFGDMMAEKYRVPIAIVPIGRGATSVRQWLPKGDIVTIEPTRTVGLQKLPNGTWQSEGQLYDRMVDRMKSLGPHGFRAMLWHQGESDAHQANGHTLPGTDYTTNLEHIIVQSRKDIGWNAPWFVAQATWGSQATPADPNIRDAQKKVWQDNIALPGPDTDTLLNENRQKNGTGVHMSDLGLHNHARLWVEAIGNWLDSLQK